MADSEEHRAIYRRVIDGCQEYHFEGLWSRLGRWCDVWELADTGQALVDLEGEFGRAAIVEAGVVSENRDGSLRFGRGGTHGSAIVCPLRKEPGAGPYDLVTVDGCLSGRLPVCAVLQDAGTNDARKKTYDAVLAVFCLEDLAVLRLGTLPAMLASGLSTLGGRALDEFCYAYEIRDINGRWRVPTGWKPADTGKYGPDHGMGGGVSGMSAEDLLEPTKLIVVGWSPARLSAEPPEGLEALVTHLRRIEKHLRLEMYEIELWRPTPQALEGIAVCAKYGRHSDFSAAVKKSVGESTRPLTCLPDRGPQNLPAAVTELQKAIRNPMADGERETRLWEHYREKIGSELVRPLMEQAAMSKEPRERALLMSIAGLSQLAHPHAMSIAGEIASSTKNTSPSDLGLLPERQLRQLLAMNDRLIGLAKECRPCQWK